MKKKVLLIISLVTLSSFTSFASVNVMGIVKSGSEKVLSQMEKRDIQMDMDSNIENVKMSLKNLRK